jgi:hypothetical protein
MNWKYSSLLAAPLLAVVCAWPARADQPPAATPPPATVPAPGSGQTPTSPATTQGAAGTPPAGATAQCKDAGYSESKSHSGACSKHGGVDHGLK